MARTPNHDEDGHGQEDGDQQNDDPEDGVTDAEEWDERYAASDRIWSGEPNGTLVREAADLPPGRALDVGCGEGADAVWLASRGWSVTALDVSQVALDRARGHAADAGVDVVWIQSGLLDAGLPDDGFDLVSAQYPVLRRTDDADAEWTLIRLVAPGGTLLVVHHDTRDWAAADHDAQNHDTQTHDTHGHGEHIDPDDWVQPPDVARLLGPEWTIEVDELRARTISGGAGAGHSHDVVLRARRGGRRQS